MRSGIKKFLERLGLTGDLVWAVTLLIAGITAMTAALVTIIRWVGELGPNARVVFLSGIAVAVVGLLTLLNKGVRVAYSFAATKVSWIPQTRSITRRAAELAEELRNAHRVLPLNAVMTAHRKLVLGYSNLHVTFDVEKELRFAFKVVNHSLATVTVTGQWKGVLRSAVGGQHNGKARIQRVTVPEDEEREFTLIWEMSDGLAKSLAFYAGRTDPWDFIFESIEVEITAEYGDEIRTHWIGLPGRTPVLIPDHVGFERIRKAFDPKTLLALDSPESTPPTTS